MFDEYCEALKYLKNGIAVPEQHSGIEKALDLKNKAAELFLLGNYKSALQNTREVRGLFKIFIAHLDCMHT